LEVQGRTDIAPRRLTPALARLWARRWAVLALATVMTLAAVVVDAQPIRSPWWTYADADASYTASALTLVLGEQVRFLDHPGLPLTEAAALVFGVDALLEGSVSNSERLAYVDTRLLDLDRTRSVFRGIAIALYLLGALLSFLLVARLFGHWTWGFAAGILWVAAPGLIAMSIQLRPDVLLAIVTLVFAYFVARAVETRSATTYAWAAAAAGFGSMTKLHAVGLLVPLAVALVWRRPVRPPTLDLRVAGLIGALLAVPALLFNLARLPFDFTTTQTQALALLLAAAAACVAAIVFVPRLAPYALVGAGLLGGLSVPIVLDVPDGLQALVQAAKTATGQGVQEGVESFSTPFSDIDNIVGARVMVVFLLAAVAGVVGLVRRRPVPVIWATGAFVLAVLAFLRPPAIHYFAPAFVLSVLCLLWLARSDRPGPVPLLLWPVVLLLAWPAYDNREVPAVEAERFAAVVEPAKRFLETRIGPGEVALVPSYWPFADSRFYELAKIYVPHTTPYEYHYLPTTSDGRAYAAQHGLRPRWFVGPQAATLTEPTTVTLAEMGDFALRRAEGGEVVAEIVGGPGVDQPWTP
jgi:Dolichyl-phosphate-mannose-protein mannosyltransferase